MNTLLTALRNDSNWTITENGAPTHKTTLSDVLDLFYHAPAKRGQSVERLFENAYLEDSLLATLVAFYVRDVRGGQGERELFRQMLRWLEKNDVNTFNRIVPLVPVYGRWDDLIEFVQNTTVRQLIADQFRSDMRTENPSLLAKWMPSENTSSEKTRMLAAKWRVVLGLTPREYRTRLSLLRKRINVLERLMSSKSWSEINYEQVPSNASLRYRKAFSKNDADRYVAYLESVKKGEKTIKAATLYPYELVQVYTRGGMYGMRHADCDETVELQWKALPNYCESDKNALVVCDVSGSMFSGMGKVMPIDISVSLAIYIAERNHGAFKNNFITFSSNPTLITLKGNTLKNKVEQVYNAGVGYDTNIQAVFDMLLRVALQNHILDVDMPESIFVVSDMEFNDMHVGGRTTNFDVIQRKYAAAGYTMPRLIFWNVASRADQTPVTMNEKGVYLVSGASPSIFKAAINARATTPVEMMLEVLESERYAPVVEALQ